MRTHEHLVGLSGRLIAGAALLGSMAAPTLAQITPERTYYGVDRPIPVVVEAPENAESATIGILNPDGSELTSVAVAPGRVDLAAMFPQLWSGEHKHLHYAQLFVDGDGVGAPLVLQPMLTPQYAYPVDQNNQIYVPPLPDPRRQARPVYQQEMIDSAFRQQGQEPRPREVFYSGIRAWVDKHIVFETSMGEIEFRLRPDHAPNTSWNFLSLADGGFYTDIIFHRIVAEASNGHPFVIQVGDPTGTGAGGPGYLVDLEPTALPHDFGVLSMARSLEPNSNGSQVFVCLSRPGTAFLDGNYTAFGEAVRGADVIRAIASVPTAEQGKPVDPPVLKAARVIDAPPFGNRLEPLSATQAAPAQDDAAEGG